MGPILGQYTAPLATVPSSSDGIDEYRATTFNSAMRGHLLVQQLNGALRGVKLTPTGTDVESVVTISPGPPALDVLAGPGGVILGIDHGSNSITVSKPNDAGAIGMIAYEYLPVARHGGRRDALHHRGCRVREPRHHHRDHRRIARRADVRLGDADYGGHPG